MIRQQLKSWLTFRSFLFLEGIFIGICAGALGVAFRLALSYLEELRTDFIVWAQNAHFTGFLAWFSIIIFAGLLAGYAAKLVPKSSGSGIPQVKAILSNQLRVNWIKIILAKFFGGLFALGSGFSLGREGPTVQLGAAIAQGISRLTGRLKIEEKYLITSGAAAGLSAAFNAPLAAVIFALEELTRNFSPYVLSSALAASVFADLVSQKITGKSPVLKVTGLSVIPLRYFILFIVIGLLAGFAGILFNKAIEKSLDYIEKKCISKFFLVLSASILVALIGFWMPMTLGGGNDLIIDIINGKLLLTIIPLLFVLKFLLTIICYATGVPGGIFLPMLVLGALLGAFYGQGIAMLDPILGKYAGTYAVLGMAAIFSAIVRAPVTGTVLIVEMTGSFEHLFPLLTVSFSAYVLAEHFHVEPIYDMLMHRMLNKEKRKEKGTENECSSTGSKVILDVTVESGSPLEFKMVKNISLPKNILMLNITRGHEEIIPRGDTPLYAGDIITVLLPENQSSELYDKLRVLTLCNKQPSKNK